MFMQYSENKKLEFDYTALMFCHVIDFVPYSFINKKCMSFLLMDINLFFTPVGGERVADGDVCNNSGEQM